MKKVLALILSLVMVFAISATAFAAESPSTDPIPPVVPMTFDAETIIPAAIIGGGIAAASIAGSSVASAIIIGAAGVATGALVYVAAKNYKNDNPKGDCDIVITPVSEAVEGVNDDLIAAYEEIKAGKAFDIPEGYVVSDVFDVQVKGDCDEFYKDGKLVMTFDIGAVPGDTVYAKVKNDGAWSDVAGVVNNGDGTVTVTFDKVGPVAFMVKASDTVKAPATGASSFAALYALAAVLGLGAVAFFADSKKRVLAK